MQFSRTSGQRFYKRLFLVGVEGTRTERDYFSCYEALGSHLPNYRKSLNRADFNEENISAAIARAKSLLGSSDPADWPREPGKTTVFTLCEAIRKVNAEEQAKLLSEYSADGEE